MRPAALVATLSGRADERATLLDVVRAGLDGSPRAVLVHGEAGIGKTVLVRSVCAQVADEGVQVLWGQSLRFGAVEAMYHPLVLALEAWLAQAPDSEKDSVIRAVPGAALILPSLGAAPADAPSALMTVVDALLNRVIALGPTVLVVDDVHWADPATWDALCYLVAGFARQRFALVTTHRDEAAGGDAFQHWLGNIRRLPDTEALVLTRLDRDATGDQIAELIGREPSTQLVDQVYERSRGNPYFSELLVRRGDLDSSALPDDVPDELSQALLDAWRRLSREAREIARILAIAGRPSGLQTLAGIAEELGVSQAGSIREAVEAGVIVLDGDGAWFRHPLLASVLAESYLPGEAAPAHTAWAAHLASVSSEGVGELRRLGGLAAHHEHAGNGQAAYVALLEGADLAEKLCARREAADLLVRAAKLWAAGDDVTGTEGHARLLERAGRACESVGRQQDGYGLLRAAQELVSSERDPLWASTLAAEVALMEYLLLDTRTSPIAEWERVVELSRAEPDSPEHADAVGMHATLLWWADRKHEARRVVEEAVAAADRSGSAVAVSRAHSTRAEIVMETDLRQADADATVSWEHALASGDPLAIGGAHMIRLLISWERGDLRSYAERARDVYEWGVPLGTTVTPCCHLAGALVEMGDLVEAESVVRTGLSAPWWANFEAIIRLIAVVLAVRRGATGAARGHLARAQEVRPQLEEHPECDPGAPIAEMLLAEDDPAAAFELLARVLPLTTDVRALDELMVWGARAAADLVQQASDDRDQAAVRRHRESLTRLMKTRASLPGIIFQPSCPQDTIQPARAALFVAEQGRAEGVDDQVGLWRDALAACATAGLGWEQQLSSWRLAFALIEAGAPGTEPPELLRAVYDYATRQGAEPLKAKVEELAASARISLAAPSLPTSDVVPAAFTALTARENEVLAHLVANRTNAEIADALFISEKTVSVHVSNLLRKTETGSRREVAALARRVGWGHDG